MHLACYVCEPQNWEVFDILFLLAFLLGKHLLRALGASQLFLYPVPFSYLHSLPSFPSFSANGRGPTPDLSLILK